MITIRWEDNEYGQVIKVKCRMAADGRYGISLGRGIDKNNLFDNYEKCQEEVYRLYSGWKTFKVYEDYKGGFFNKGMRHKEMIYEREKK